MITLFLGLIGTKFDLSSNSKETYAKLRTSGPVVSSRRYTPVVSLDQGKMDPYKTL